MTPQIDSVSGSMVNMVGLRKVMGVSLQAVQTMISQGMPHEGGKGRSYKFNTADCIKWRMAHIRKVMESQFLAQMPDDVPEEKMTLGEAKRRREVAIALKAELELANARKQVANIEDLAGLFSDALVNVRANLTSMSSRLAGVLSHQDEDEVAKLLDSEINDILENVSNYKVK
jgi:phage terminase Nu1 subunit (DNA packaging protein)